MVASSVSTRPLTAPAVPMVVSRAAADTTSSPAMDTRVGVVATAAATAVTTVEATAVVISSNSSSTMVATVETVATAAAAMAAVMVRFDSNRRGPDHPANSNILQAAAPMLATAAVVVSFMPLFLRTCCEGIARTNHLFYQAGATTTRPRPPRAINE